MCAEEDKSGRESHSNYLAEWRSRHERAHLMSFLGPGIMEILDSLPYYVLLVDRHHRILLANKATREHLKLEPQEITGELCPQVVHGLKKDEEYPGCPLKEAVESGAAVEKQHFDEENGRWLNIAIYPSGAFAVSGERIYLHMIRDITAQKQMEEELEALRQENRRLAAELETGQRK